MYLSVFNGIPVGDLNLGHIPPTGHIPPAVRFLLVYICEHEQNSYKWQQKGLAIANIQGAIKRLMKQSIL
jgi:hypothetical protein